jgi:bifunctional DNA-binding transcriptional regulator/antitoxin component of YhaV-PrlF toxin-antitoxin module
MDETCIRVNENGRVVIPVAFGKTPAIRASDELVLRIEDDADRNPETTH